MSYMMNAVELFSIIEESGGISNFRICQRCGKASQSGFTDSDCDLFICEKCFVPEMDDLHGQCRWKSVDDDGCGGYYVDENGDGTGIYWTTFEEGTGYECLDESEKVESA